MSRVKVHFQNTFNGDNEKECAACPRKMHLRDLNMFCFSTKIYRELHN